MQSEERSPAARRKLPKLPERVVKYLRRRMNQEKCMPEQEAGDHGER
jgi:hypothetical protein